MLAGSWGAASALGTGSLSQTVLDNATPLTTVTVNFSGFPTGNTTVFVQQCQKNGNALTPGDTFSYISDCSNAENSTNANGGATGSGTATIKLRNGDELVNGEWGCGPLSTPELKHDTCFVRITPSVKSNTDEDVFLPFTFGVVNPNPDIPEAPLNVLLPASAAALIGGAVLVTRKRRLAKV